MSVDYDCRQLLEGPVRGRYRCPVGDHRNPYGVTLTPDGRHWRCWKCGAHGDAIDLLRLDGLGYRDALERLGLADDPAYAPVPARQRSAAERERERRRRELAELVQLESGVRSPAWFELAERIAVEAQRILWGDAGREARAYLRRRGIDARVAQAARLGFLPQPIELPELMEPGEDRPPVLSAGVVIPWWSGSDHRAPWIPASPSLVTAIKVRRLGRRPSPKYVSMRGSSFGGVYPRETAVRGGRPLVLVEGELDALALWSVLAGLPIGIATVGGATQRPKLEAADVLAESSLWILGHDGDPAGDEAAARWARLARLGGVECARERPSKKDWSDTIAAVGAEAVRRWFVESYGLVPRSLADA